MSTVKLKTSELTGAALDWAVAVATRGQDNMPHIRQWMLWDDYHPSSSWLLAGPILAELMATAEYAITPFCDGSCEISNTDNEGFAYNPDKWQDIFSVVGDNLLMATCRAVVARKLGDTIEVPAELVQGSAV